MTTRSAKIVLELMVDKFVQNSKKAQKAQEDVAKASEEAGKKSDQSSDEQVQASEKAAAAAKKQAEATEKAGTILTAFGVATVAALGASAKAAMDWESAWAGVTKTVDGSAEEMAALEGELRGLARTLPATHTEIAAVAEAAGQLGVKREDVAKFTKTMVDLGETTNLTADEAATSIAQLANIMGTAGGDIDNFAATLVDLGNAGASTEKDILDMALRIAGAGKLVGATEGEVLALASTLASLGIEAQLGGGVTSRVLQRMYTDVMNGGEGLERLAQVSGKSAKEFATAFQNDPIRALDMVAAGLGKVKDSGGNVVQTMDDLGIKGTEETGVMLRLVGASGLLTKDLDRQGEAWTANTALIAEASKRYETTESKVTVAWNNIKDAAIDAGAVLLPVISDVAQSVVGLSQAFGDLPAPVQGVVTGLGAVVGTAALVGGGLMLLLPKVRDGIQAFKDLDLRSDGSSRGLGKLAKAATIASVAFVGFEVVKGLHNSMQPAAKSVEEMTQALVGLDKESGSLENVFKDIGAKEFEGELGSAGEALDKLINQDFNSAVESFGATAMGLDNGMSKIADAFDKTDSAIAGAATSGNMEMAAKGFQSIAKSAEAKGIAIEETAKRFPKYLDALRAMATESKVALTDTELLDFAMGKVPAKLEAAAAGGDKAAQALVDTGGAAAAAAISADLIAESLDEVGISAEGAVTDIEKFTGVLFAAGLLHLSASDAAIAYQGSIRALTDGIVNNGKSLDINTKQGGDNQAAYNNIAKAAMAAMTATAEETLATQGSTAAQEGLQKGLRTSYDDLIAAAGQFDITGDAADTMARKALGIPKEVPIDTWVNDKASGTLDGIKGKADGLNGKRVDIYVNTHESITRYLTEKGASSLDAAQNGGKAEGGAILKRAGGGSINGPGTSTSDDVPIWASDGEHMFDRGDVIKMGGQQAVYKFRRELHAGQALAGGGAVGVAPSTASRSVASASIGTPTITLEGLTVLVTNPFTGEQVRGIVTSVARQEAVGAVNAADGQAPYMRTGRRA